MGAGGDLGGGMVDLQRLIRMVFFFCFGCMLGGYGVYAEAAQKWYLTSLMACTSPGPNDATYQYSTCPSYQTGTRLSPYQPPLGTTAHMAQVIAWAAVGSGAFPASVYYNNVYQPADKRVFPACGAPIYDSNSASGGWQQITIQQQYCNPVNNSPAVSVKRALHFVYQEEVQCVTGVINPDGSCFTCPADRVWNGSTCESPCQAKAGNSYGTSNSWAMLDVDTVPSGVPTFCDGSCSVTGGKVECESVSAGGTSGDRISLGSTCTVQGPFTYTGQGCGPGGSAPMLVGTDDVQKPWWDKGLEQKDCSAQGGYWGNVNGIDACVRPQPGETFDKETSTGNETTGTSETAADGTTTEKTTSTTTECKDGKCTTTTTTTTTTKGADGQQIGEATTETKSEVKPEADFCKLNPQHAQCAGTQTGGSFSGGCTTGFACTGDAVQCAIARAAHTEACNQKAIADDAQGFMDGLGAVEPTDAKVAEALNRDGEFDFDIAEAFQDAQQNYVTFTASCLPPMGFTFKGQTYSFNTGFICEIGDFVRLMLHLIAYMTVLRVISRAFG